MLYNIREIKRLTKLQEKVKFLMKKLSYGSVKLSTILKMQL